jgi:hypothetical protein
MQPWEFLAENLKESNRRQADHIAVKLRAIGCEVSRPEPKRSVVTGFKPEEIELLARMEHQRWNAEKYVDGWTNGQARDDEKKIHDCLVDWDKLPEEIREYDRHAVRKIPELIALIGKTIYRETDEIKQTSLSLVVNSQSEIRLRVGVTGHRYLADVEKITERVHQVLEKELPKLSRLNEQVRAANQPHCAYTLLTSLAEGADRMVAKEVLKLVDSQIEAVLPLCKEDYEQDFCSSESLQEFTELFNQSSRSIGLEDRSMRDLPSGTDDEEFRRRAYEAAGRYVVDHCDVMIALWDGQPSQGKGGTAEIVACARQKSRPLIIISTVTPYQVAVEEGSGFTDTLFTRRIINTTRTDP